MPRAPAIFVIRSGILTWRHANLRFAPGPYWQIVCGSWPIAAVEAEPIGKPSAGLDPNLGCARSSSAALALGLALIRSLALPNASQVSQPNGIGGPCQNPEPPNKPSAPG